MSDGTSVYDLLRLDYPTVARHISGSEARGNESHDNRPFDHGLKADWIQDMREELADAMVYAEAEVRRLGDDRRLGQRGKHIYLTMRTLTTRLASMLGELDGLDHRMGLDRDVTRGGTRSENGTARIHAECYGGPEGSFSFDE